MPANPQDTTYGSDADLLEERGNVWKVRAEKAEADLANLRAKYEGAMEVDRTEIAACAEKIATLERALADERQTRAALEAQIVTLRGAAEIADAETARWRHEATRMTEEAATLRRHSAAAVLREREECAEAMERLRGRASVISPSAVRVVEEGIAAIRARSK